MAISQMALIQSLGEAMSWLEREIAWGVPATELRHLCGRIGELFVAVITNGRMATEVNQKGYDVVSSTNERISVKTTATTKGEARHVTFNVNTLDFVDRIIILRINTEEREIEILLDAPIKEATKLLTFNAKHSTAVIQLNPLICKPSKPRVAKTVSEVKYGDYTIRELENGSIEAEINGESVVPVRPVLRELAATLNIGLLNSNGNPYNTRQLGGLIMRSVEVLKAQS
jgi:hypothetical protein